jgi:hypothetical protein
MGLASRRSPSHWTMQWPPCMTSSARRCSQDRRCDTHLLGHRQKLGGPSRRGFPGFWKEGLQKSRRKPPLFPQCVSGRGGLRRPTGCLLPEDGLFRKYVAVRCAEAAAFCKSPSGRFAAEGGKPVCRKGMFAGRRESLREVGCCKHCAVFSAVCAQHAECRSCGCVPACVADLARYC